MADVLALIGWLNGLPDPTQANALARLNVLHVQVLSLKKYCIYSPNMQFSASSLSTEVKV